MYQISYARSVQKDLDKIPNADAENIREAIKVLVHSPMPFGYKKLSGKLGLYRIKEGNYRIVYAFSPEEKQIQITRVKHRKDAYKSL